MKDGAGEARLSQLSNMPNGSIGASAGCRSTQPRLALSQPAQCFTVSAGAAQPAWSLVAAQVRGPPGCCPSPFAKSIKGVPVLLITLQRSGT